MKQFGPIILGALTITITLATHSSFAAGNLVLDGDSIAASMGAGTEPDLASEIVALLGFHDKVTVVGVPGATVQSRVQLFDQRVSPLFDPTQQPNVILFHGGDNDIYFGADAAEAYPRLALYVSKAHASGWKVVISTELQRYDFTAQKQDQLLQFNKMIIENTAKADAVADFASNGDMESQKSRSDPHLYNKDVGCARMRLD
jgi:hypothetical protein